MNSLPYIYSIAAAQGLLLAIALWRKKVNKDSNHILSVWMLFLVFDLSIKVIYLNDKETPLASSYILALYFPFIYGSFFYIYVRSLVRKIAFHLKDFIHFAAFVIFIGINLPVIINPSLINTNGLVYSNIVLFSYSISYVIAGLLLVIKYRKDLQQQNVDIEGIDLKWLMIMSYSQVVIWVVAISQWLLPFTSYNTWTIYITVSLWIIITGYLSLSQQNVPEISSIKIPKNQHDDERFEEVKIKLNSLIQDENIHMQASLTIGQLAKKSGYPEYLISLFINRFHNMSFRDYINGLRINEAKIMLIDNDNKQSILDIAYECGFNSKSTFNSAFKKITQQTPSQFKQQ